jgi:hypothetical protein
VAIRWDQVVTVWMLSVSPIWCAVQGRAAEQDAVRDHAEQSFNQIPQRKDQNSGAPRSGPPHDNHASGRYSSDQYVIGIGQGDMTKGPIVCQRVSELSARTDLAKQIRIFVKEHMVDRVRERTGKDAEQDIELTREQIVQEYLQGVKIIDRHIDEQTQTCTATAVMPRSQLQISAPPPDHPQPAPITR